MSPKKAHLVLTILLVVGLILSSSALAAPNKLVFQRGAGNSSQPIAYWAGSSLLEGGGGPVPSFVNPPQPAWVEIPVQGSHMIEYAKNQPIKAQKIFFNIITNNDKNNPVCVVSAQLNYDGSVTDAGSNCPASSQVVVKSYADHVAVMLPPEIPAPCRIRWSSSAVPARAARPSPTGRAAPSPTARVVRCRPSSTLPNPGLGRSLHRRFPRHHLLGGPAHG